MVTPASGDFVTVHDYLSTVHPWLMDPKEVIKRARADILGENDVSDLMVKFVVLESLFIDERSHWIEHAAIRLLVVANQTSTTVSTQSRLTQFGPDPQPVPGQPQPLTQDLSVYSSYSPPPA